MTEMNLPPEIRNDPCWVNVKADSKIPWQSAKYKAASPSNADTWDTFEMALNSLYSGKYDGLGYCFHDNGIVGIDIDAGFDSDGFLSELACDIINRCHSYTEFSRSGRGVHILLRGKLPWGGANNHNGVEIYQTGRYFIMTGKQLIYDEIADNQNAIDYIIRRYFSEVTEKKSEVDDKKSEVGRKNVIYAPKVVWKNVKLVKEYPSIPDGCRNISLTSYAGQLHCQGMDAKSIKSELLKVNKAACNPPLDEREIDSIVKSVMRYER